MCGNGALKLGILFPRSQQEQGVIPFQHDRALLLLHRVGDTKHTRWTCGLVTYFKSWTQYLVTFHRSFLDPVHCIFKKTYLQDTTGARENKPQRKEATPNFVAGEGGMFNDK